MCTCRTTSSSCTSSSLRDLQFTIYNMRFTNGFKSGIGPRLLGDEHREMVILPRLADDRQHGFGLCGLMKAIFFAPSEKLRDRERNVAVTEEKEGRINVDALAPSLSCKFLMTEPTDADGDMRHFAMTKFK